MSARDLAGRSGRSGGAGAAALFLEPVPAALLVEEDAAPRKAASVFLECAEFWGDAAEVERRIRADVSAVMYTSWAGGRT